MTHTYRLSTDAGSTVTVAANLDAAISASQIVPGAHAWEEACDIINRIGDGAWLRANSATDDDCVALCHEAE